MARHLLQGRYKAVVADVEQGNSFATLLSGKRWFVVQHKKFAPAQLGEAQGTAFPVAKLDLENFGCEHFDNGSDLAARQAKRRLIIKQRNDIEEFCGYRLHNGFHST